MLPTTVAIVSATFTGGRRGTALGTMGGVAAVAGAAGPVVGGLLTATLGWQAVFLINVPLAAVAAVTAMAAVASDPPPSRHAHIDFVGAALLGVAIIALIVGLGQSQSWGWDSPLVWALLGVAVAAAALFVLLNSDGSSHWSTSACWLARRATAPQSSARAWPAQRRWGLA